MIYGWDHPATARRYEQFCDKHDRYRRANEQLIAHAKIEPGQRVVDFAAGTGRTAELALAAGARVVCWEPAEAMRAAGARRAPQAEWRDSPPERTFERVLCGAAAWQWQPFASFAALAASRLRPGGALAFNMPSLYAGAPDEPGGGADPLLLELPGRLARGAEARIPRSEVAASEAPARSKASIEDDLAAAGFDTESWSFRLRITQECLCDWYAIPVLTDALLGELTLEERDARLEQARGAVDLRSWKWEGWMGWTAWKR